MSVNEPSTVSILDMTGRTIITGCSDEWMNGCSDDWMNGCLDDWMNGCSGEWINGGSDVRKFGYTFNVSNLVPGAYFVRVATRKGVLVKKFIVK